MQLLTQVALRNATKIAKAAPSVPIGAIGAASRLVPDARCATTTAPATTTEYSSGRHT